MRTTTAYRPGRTATLQVPDRPTAVLVLVPGGAWAGCDPTGLEILGGRLAANGLASVTITYGTCRSGDLYPVPAQDVACAVAFAASAVPDVPVVLLGHSAGAHLSLLVGLRPDQGGDCAHPTRAADAVVGMAGAYDIARTGAVGRNLFGVDLAADRALWAAGNPTTWVGERPDLPVLLLHGAADEEVPPSMSGDAADALARAGHDVARRTYPGIDHNGVLRGDVVADDVVSWVRTLAVR